jgi:hypothetical protein
MPNPDVSMVLADLAQRETDPVTQILIATIQERKSREADIARLDGDVDELHAEIRKLKTDNGSLRAAKEDITKKLNSLTWNKETVNVFDLEGLLNESWDDKYQEIGTELRKIRIKLGFADIPKDGRNCIPGTPKNRQPREHYKATAVEFCKKWGYEVPTFLL